MTTHRLSARLVPRMDLAAFMKLLDGVNGMLSALAPR